MRKILPLLSLISFASSFAYAGEFLKVRFIDREGHWLETRLPGGTFDFNCPEKDKSGEVCIVKQDAVEFAFIYCQMAAKHCAQFSVNFADLKHPLAGAPPPILTKSYLSGEVMKSFGSSRDSAKHGKREVRGADFAYEIIGDRHPQNQKAEPYGNWVIEVADLKKGIWARLNGEEFLFSDGRVRAEYNNVSDKLLPVREWKLLDQLSKGFKEIRLGWRDQK